jgi:hypothetical protein
MIPFALIKQLCAAGGVEYFNVERISIAPNVVHFFISELVDNKITESAVRVKVCTHAECGGAE